MEEKVIEQARYTLDLYRKPFSDKGLYKNLETWERNKGWLVDLLRKHPDWKEDELAVVLKTKAERKMDFGLIQSKKDCLFDLIYYTDATLESRDVFRDSINDLLRLPGKIISEYLSSTVEYIKNWTGAKCAVGQKTSRAINAICKSYGLDKLPTYDAIFAGLADALNPINIERVATLSVHPCDYLQMSNKENSWNSCHNLIDGGYQAGTLSYMNDEVSMIFSTISSDAKKDFRDRPKVTRQVFAYGNGVLLQSRLYPNANNEEQREDYRKMTQAAIAVCEGVPNIWILKRDIEAVEDFVSTRERSLHYRDYEYSSYHPNVSFLKAIHDEDYGIEVGYSAYCFGCGDMLEDSSSVECDDFDGSRRQCNECGDWFNGDDVWFVDGNVYCADCVPRCEDCGEVLYESYDVYGRFGERRDVCDDCRSGHYTACDECRDYHHEGSTTSIDGSYYCESCVDRLFTHCADCGDYVVRSEAEYLEGTSYCESCYEEYEVKEEEEGQCA